MIYSNAIALVLALAPATLFAAPTKFSSVADLISRRGIPAQALKALEDGNCDLDALTLPIGGLFPSLQPHLPSLPSPSYPHRLTLHQPQPLSLPLAPVSK
jgi:hypothetical protein